jgi:hypothetical protein
MAEELPPELQPLPVFKVLYRNTNRIQEHGGRKGEVLRQVEPATLSQGCAGGEALREADENIRGNLQARASAVIARYGQLGHAPRPVFDLLLRYAVSEDGALHAEKFYRTVSEEFSATRSAFRWRHLAALARVTASEFGRPASGMAEARALLKV